MDCFTLLCCLPSLWPFEFMAPDHETPKVPELAAMEMLFDGKQSILCTHEYTEKAWHQGVLPLLPLSKLVLFLCI